MRAIGLMSGTSLDGLDMAAIEVVSLKPPLGLQVLGFATYPYPEDIRRMLGSLIHEGTAQQICRANTLLSVIWAEMVRGWLKDEGLKLSSFDVIGSHGQTIWHEGEAQDVSGHQVASTLQIGDGSTLAGSLQRPVICDFRPADMAHGGQGAPLVPLFDWLHFTAPDTGRAMLNLGGIANVTLLPAGATLEQIRGYDTGPGNMLMDALMSLYTDGAEEYDLDGQRAAAGEVQPRILRSLLDHPHILKAAPKSTGREEFGMAFARRLHSETLEPKSVSMEDALATACAFTAESVADHIRRENLAGAGIQEVIASGGGVRNPTLMARLERELGDVALRATDELGIPPEAKEAIAFAVLGLRTLQGMPGNAPKVTGASRPVILGKRCEP